MNIFFGNNHFPDRLIQHFLGLSYERVLQMFIFDLTPSLTFELQFMRENIHKLLPYVDQVRYEI